MIPAANFDQRIAVWQKTITKNAMGEDVQTWAPLASMWAMALPPRGRDYMAAAQEQHLVDARFLVRARTGLTTGQRVTWRGQNYDIVNLVPGVRKYAGTIEIQAVHGARDGR